MLAHKFCSMPSELSPIFKWRRVEGRFHHPQLSKAPVRPKSWLQTNFSVIKKVSCRDPAFSPYTYMFLAKIKLKAFLFASTIHKSELILRNHCNVFSVYALPSFLKFALWDHPGHTALRASMHCTKAGP